MAYPFAAQPYENPPAAPGAVAELEFWRNVMKDPFAGLRSGANTLWPGLTAPANPAMNLGANLRAAVDVLGGVEDPITRKKPLAGKPMDTKRRPVPANTPNPTPVQKAGPATPDAEDVEPETMPMGVPMPIDNEPPPARGVVKVKLGDGREFDYGAGESIPEAEQGTFGGMQQPEGYMTGAGFVGTGTRTVGGQGKPGSASMMALSEDSTTPAADQLRMEKLARSGVALQQARADRLIADPYADLKAQTEAQIVPRIAAEYARDSFERDRLAERLKAEREAQASIEDYEMQRRAKEAKVVAWEQYAEKSGDEQAAKRAAALREQFERESAESKEVLDRLLASKGLVRGTYAIK